MDAVCRGAHPPANRPAISVPPEQGEAAAVPAARTIFRVPGHGPFMMHTTTTAATTTAVPAARTDSTGTNAVPRLVRAWTLLSDRDGQRLEWVEKGVYRAWREDEGNSVAVNPLSSPKAILVRFVRGGERILAEEGGLVPSDAEVERDSHGEARLVFVAVEG